MTAKSLSCAASTKRGLASGPPYASCTAKPVVAPVPDAVDGVDRQQLDVRDAEVDGVVRAGRSRRFKVPSAVNVPMCSSCKNQPAGDSTLVAPARTSRGRRRSGCLMHAPRLPPRPRVGPESASPSPRTKPYSSPSIVGLPPAGRCGGELDERRVRPAGELDVVMSRSAQPHAAAEMYSSIMPRAVHLGPRPSRGDRRSGERMHPAHEASSTESRATGYSDSNSASASVGADEPPPREHVHRRPGMPQRRPCHPTRVAASPTGRRVVTASAPPRSNAIA